MSSGAPEPPILVGTQPGSSEFEPGNAEGEHRIMELALGVGGRAIPATLLPEDVVEIGTGVMMHTGTEIDEAFRPLD